MFNFKTWLFESNDIDGLIFGLKRNINDYLTYLAIADFYDENGHVDFSNIFRVIGDGLKNGKRLLTIISKLKQSDLSKLKEFFNLSEIKLSHSGILSLNSILDMLSDNIDGISTSLGNFHILDCKYDRNMFNQYEYSFRGIFNKHEAHLTLVNDRNFFSVHAYVEEDDNLTEDCRLHIDNLVRERSNKILKFVREN